MKIVIGNDHAGTLYKKAIVDYLLSKNYQVINVGTDDTKSVDYPDFAHPVGEIMDKGEADYGIVICGSGNGVAMTVNKPARFTAQEQAIEIVKTFLMTDFEGGRHLRRIEKI